MRNKRDSNHSLKYLRYRNSQTWSTDVLIAAGIFVLAILIFYWVIDNESSDSFINSLQEESKTVSERFIVQETPSDNTTFIIGNKIDNERLRNIAKKPYDEIRSALGLHNDFCIYFEDQDGNLINISTITGEDRAGIGSDKININNIPCGNG